MPPWESVPATVHICQACEQPFEAKRSSAKYCSPRCQNRTRIRPKPTPEQRRQWRLKRLDRPGYRERVNAIDNARSTRIRRWLDELKVSTGCCDCGFNAHPSALHFDHVSSNKSMNVCNAKSIEQAKREIAKCVVRCANCHAVKTWPNRLDRTSP